ncbi:MAG: thioredoxin family protein [Patescibacteria group bacterium]|nr:thioredoxin family protein [Patescibacteria group bacterium]
MLKKFLFLLFFASFLIIPCQIALAEEAKTVNIYFFWGKGCPHCEQEKPFLEKMAKKYPEVKIHSYEAWGSKQNRDLMVGFAQKLNANVSGVPFTVVGEHYIIGWMNEEYSGAKIEDAIRCALNNGCRDVGAEIGAISRPGANIQNSDQKIPESITAPFFGKIEIKNFSLPVLAVVLGALDGFNPCAMWILLFLISLLLGMENKKRMWILGTTFIVASASVYFLFMAAWLNLLLFIGMVVWVRIIIGLVALTGGGYNLKEYFTNPEAGCKVTGAEKRQKIFARLKNITQQKSFYLALGGIIILAFAVNLVELICSAGLPVVFTQILSLSDLASWQYYFYILIYIFIFMLDDLFVFFAAMTTLQMTGITAKYSRWSHLIGGVLMLIIGLLLIFRPEWLMFG